MNAVSFRIFKQKIRAYYKSNARYFAWRETFDPYQIFVSEVMLQQTQVARVAEKFPQFINRFPDFAMLAAAPLQQVLAVWQGMGYNRRALALHKSAQCVMQDFKGELPATPEILETFPGIGPATARSIAAFAFNAPTVFIETNIRAVFIHFFFKKREKVSDEEILPLVAKTLDKKNPREWYYALMDYGAMLKKTHPNPSRKSIHHHAQSKFEGSNRQLRGMLVRELLRAPRSLAQLAREVKKAKNLLKKALNQLCHEEFITRIGVMYRVK